MKIINELDAGPVMKTVKIDITNECTYEKLSKKMNELIQLELKKIFNGRFSMSESTRANYARGEDTYLTHIHI